MSEKESDKTFIFQGNVNSFVNLYSDAELLLALASNKARKRLESIQLCRSALLLYIFSLEGLINRALGHFLPDRYRNFFIEREKKFTLEDKWRLLPLLGSETEPHEFNYSKYPWSHFVELIGLRNDFIHPKHDWPAYSRAITSHRFENLSWKEIPTDSGIAEKDIVYRQTQIPKNPSLIYVEDVEQVKQVVDDIISELDRLLDGKLLHNNWIMSHEMKLIYPPGATLNDIPLDPDPPQLPRD